MKLRKLVIVLAHAFVGWALRTASMGIGLAILPLQTALIFVGFVIAMDFFVVALLINRSLEMFESRAGDVDPLRLDLCGDLRHRQVRHKKADLQNGGPYTLVVKHLLFIAPNGNMFSPFVSFNRFF